MWLALIASAWSAECSALAPDGPDELSRTPGAAALDSYLFPADLDRADPERKGIRTDGVVIVHHAKVVYERYGGEWNADRPHLAWSVSKSFTNALTGIAVGERRVELDGSICDYRPAARPESCAVRVRDALEFASGFDWHETYEGHSPTSSSVLAMLYGEGERDTYAFVTRHPLRDAPGTSWMYSSGDTNVLSGVVRAALEPQYGERYPWTLLFDPLDMKSARWERDGAGTYIGSSYVYATPRDLSKFGMLYLQDGCYAGKRLLPEGWVASSAEVSGPMRGKTLDREPGDVQGRQFWLNRTVPEIGQTEIPWPGVPDDAYAARGHWKQSITMIPSLDLVVVRLGDDRDDTFDHAAFLRLAVGLVDGTAVADASTPAPAASAPPVPKLPSYATDLLHLASGFAAKESCSCVFVSGRSLDDCKAFTRVSPAVATFRIDDERREVVAHALGAAKTVARFVDEPTGCVLLPRAPGDRW